MVLFVFYSLSHWYNHFLNFIPGLLKESVKCLIKQAKLSMILFVIHSLSHCCNHYLITLGSPLVTWKDPVILLWINDLDKPTYMAMTTKYYLYIYILGKLGKNYRIFWTGLDAVFRRFQPNISEHKGLTLIWMLDINP